MRKVFILFSLLFLFSLPIHAQEQSEEWVAFKKAYTIDVRSQKKWSDQTLASARAVQEKSKDELTLRLVQMALQGNKPLDRDDFMSLNPVKITDSLALVLLMKLTFDTPKFEGFYSSFFRLHNTSLIPLWYIKEMIDVLPENAVLVTSGNLESFQVKSYVLSQNRKLQIIDRNAFSGDAYASSFATLNPKGLVLLPWMKTQGENRIFVSLLYPNEQLLAFQKEAYVQGLTLEYSPSEKENIAINQQLVARLKYNIHTQSAYLKNYLPALYTLKKAGAKVDSYIKVIED